MIHALHGNAGLPDDLMPLLRAAGQPFQAWHLWRTLTDYPETATPDGFAVHLNAMASRDAHRPRILLGYSLGARLALHALTQQPQLWDAAILISGHPGLSTADERAARLVQDQAWAVRFLREPWPAVMAAWNAQPVLAGETVPATDQRLVEMWRHEIARACDAWSLARQMDLRTRFAAVACPVLWLTGEDDEKFTALAAESCALMPHARHAVIPEAGHRVHLDQPQAAGHAIAAFLREPVPVPSAESANPVAVPGASS